MSPARDVRQTIVHLLSNMSDSREIQTYLQRFSELDKARFAVIKVGGAILDEQLDETAAALAFLHTVGLTPIVLHGAGRQLDRRLQELDIPVERKDGLRITSRATLDAAREVFTQLNIGLVEAIRAQGVEAHGLTQGAFDAEMVDQEEYGFVGEPVRVHLDLLRSIVDSGAIPILTCMGVSPGGQLVNMNADAATRLLVQTVQPLKIVFLVDSGGLMSADGAVIDSINLVSDFDHLMEQEWVHSGMRLKLAEVKRLLDDSPASTSVSIASPTALVRELFTHGGAGTIVRRGERIHKVTDKSALDRDRLYHLIESAFGRRLEPRWWEKLRLAAAYLSEGYEAAAVVSEVDDFVYLDKFAVEEHVRGSGIGRAVWEHMVHDYPTIFWRSRSDNSFNTFYAEECDGSVKRGDWTIFWRGEEDFDRIAPAIKRLAELPPDLEPIGG